MSTLFGNLALVVATLVYLALFNMMYLQKGPKTGDAAMGYGLGIIFGFLVMLVCLVIAAAVIGWKGGFDWVGKSGGSRFILVAGGLLAAMVASFLSAMFYEEPVRMPLLIRGIVGFFPVLILALLLFSGFVLNNDLHTRMFASTYQWPVRIAFWSGIFGIAIPLAGWVLQSGLNTFRAITYVQDGEPPEDHLNSIAECDVQKNMVFLFVFTDANQHPMVRQQALDKIKSRPDWQQELIRLLECDWAPEAFTFLASNPVDDKNLLAEPVRQGILNQARLIRENIRQSTQEHHLYKGKFSWEVERVLRTVEAFENNGTDYLPAVRELRAALDEPGLVEKPQFTSISMLDKWLRKH